MNEKIMFTVYNKEWIGNTIAELSGSSVSNLYNITRCLPTCNRRHYSLKESQGYPEIEDNSDDDKSTLTIQLLFFHDGVYDYNSFIADVGGFLGLLLGHSILSVCATTSDWIESGIKKGLKMLNPKRRGDLKAGDV